MNVPTLAFATLAMAVCTSLVSAQELKIVSPSDRSTTPVLNLPAPPAEPVSIATGKPVLAETHELGLEDSTISASSPEMWMYLQELKRYDDPQIARRRRAEKVSAERRARLAAQKWYGISKSRPQANPSPFTYQFSNIRSSHATDVYRQQYYHTSTQAIGSGRQF